jgi:hypothetical protein
MMQERPILQKQKKGNEYILYNEDEYEMNAKARAPA